LTTPGFTDGDQQMRELVAQVGRKLQEMGPQIVDDMTEPLTTPVLGMDQDPQLIEMLHASIDGDVCTLGGNRSSPRPARHLKVTGRTGPTVTKQWISIDDLG